VKNPRISSLPVPPSCAFGTDSRFLTVFRQIPRQGFLPQQNFSIFRPKMHVKSL
jgi:hypothetical protein